METLNRTNFTSSILDKFNSIAKTPQDFLQQNVQSTKLKGILKDLYDFIKLDKKCPQGAGLPELIVESFGHEEIWSQLDLENDSLYFKYVTDISKILAAKDNIVDKNTIEESECSENEQEKHEETQNQVSRDLPTDSNTENSSSICSDGIDNEKEEIDSTHEEHTDNYTKNEKPPTVCWENMEQGEEENDSQHDNDRQFFNLKAMEKFLNDEDRKAMKSVKSKSRHEDSDGETESSVDLFEDIDEDSGNENYYKDFFDDPNEQVQSEHGDQDKDYSFSDSELSENDNKSDEDETNIENESNQPASTLEIRQERLKKKINHLEKQAMAEKSWQLKGETSADKRPINSLLEEVLEFDMTARPNIVVTEETNMYLEDIILQRIKDRAWDSVKRKARPVDDPKEYKKQLALDQEKSKESLAQIYEKDYLKQKEAADPESANQPEPDEAEKVATTAKIDKLFSKLDALSHFFFTPRLVKPEAKIVNNLPAISMEEVAPVATSDAALLAPEEVRAKKKGLPMAKQERTNTDKKRERRAKKAKQRKRRLEQDANQVDASEPKSKKAKQRLSTKLIREVTKDRNTSQMTLSANVTGKSSEKFFTQLQDQIKNQIQNKIAPKKDKSNKSNLSARKLKL